METTRTVTVREALTEIETRIYTYQKTRDSIGYVSGQYTSGKRAAVAVKIGCAQRMEQLTKTTQALCLVESAILNGEDAKEVFPECAKRVNRSLAHLFGKGTRLSIGGIEI